MSRGPEQLLVVDGDLAVDVEVVLGLVQLGAEDHVESRHGERHGVPGELEWRHAAVPGPVPTEQTL